MLTGDDDPDLFAAMALSHRQPELARAAWSTLVVRYGDWLTDHLMRRYGNLLGGDAGARDLAQDVWVRAYGRAASYTAPVALGGAAEIELWTKGWLRSVCRTEYLDQARAAARSPIPERGTGERLHPRVWRVDMLALQNVSSDASRRDHQRQTIIVDRIAALPERERDVFHVSFQWYCPDDHECRIPEEELNYLCKRWGVDEAYIRQIRRRVLKRVEAELAKHSLTLEMARTG